MSIDSKSSGQQTGQFITANGGELMTMPSDDAVFMISCGRWPNSDPTAIKVRCAVCERDSGVSPFGWDVYQRNPQRKFLCLDCYEKYEAMIRNALKPVLLQQPNSERPN